jgi:electron transfer flavoprotein beta subunit
MRMLVCIKQVPDTAEIRIDPVKNTLIRDGVPSIVNPFDAYALETAARLKDGNPGSEITLVSMGPAQAKAALRECLSVGGDRAFLVSGREFGGSDTLATSCILAAVVRELEAREGRFDIIFCGKQAIDGDTAQVGPELAENLGLIQITNAVEVDLAGAELEVKKETDEGYELLAVKLPCLITMTKPSYEPRYPTIRSKMAAKKAEIPTLGFTDLESRLDRREIGLSGSPTRVIKTFTPPVRHGGLRIQEASGQAAAARLLAALSQEGLVEVRK